MTTITAREGRRRNRQCTGKQRYDFEAQAQRAMELTAAWDHRLGQQRKAKGLNIYSCIFCGGGWHLGHAKKG